MTSLRKFLLGLFVISVPSTSFAADLTTPEDAIRALEAAYVDKDIEAAIAAKDFNEEARLMLLSMNAEFSEDPELVRKTAEVLELSFKKEIKEHGFPDFGDLTCTLGQPKNVTPTLVKITERCVFPDGDSSEEDLHVFNGTQGWRVVVVQQ